MSNNNNCDCCNFITNAITFGGLAFWLVTISRGDIVGFLTDAAIWCAVAATGIAAVILCAYILRAINDALVKRPRAAAGFCLMLAVTAFGIPVAEALLR